MWLHVPSECCPSLLESPGSTSGSDSLYQALASSAMWKGKRMPPQSWRRAFRRAPWMRLLSGLTFAPSMLSRGVASWIASLADSPAPTSATPDSARASKASAAGSGRIWPESYATFDPGSSSWKTCQRSLFGDLTESSPTFTRSGSMRNGSLFERPTLELHTGANGSSCWPAARAEDSETAGGHRGALDSLTSAARAWQTPGADSFRSRGGDRRSEQGLDQQARGWPTPRVSAVNGPARQTEVGAWARSRQAQAIVSVGDESSSNVPGSRPPLTDSTFGDGSTPASTRSHQSGATRRRLNPLFAAWLMGWPPLWAATDPTLCGRSEMESYRCKLRSRLWSLLSGWASSRRSESAWPTPTAQDSASSGAAGYSTDSGRHAGTTLTDAIREWAE